MWISAASITRGDPPKASGAIFRSKMTPLEGGFGSDGGIARVPRSIHTRMRSMALRTALRFMQQQHESGFWRRYPPRLFGDSSQSGGTRPNLLRSSNTSCGRQRCLMAGSTTFKIFSTGSLLFRCWSLQIHMGPKGRRKEQMFWSTAVLR